MTGDTTGGGVLVISVQRFQAQVQRLPDRGCDDFLRLAAETAFGHLRCPAAAERRNNCRLVSAEVLGHTQPFL